MDRPPETKEEQITRAENLFINGLSVHQVLLSCRLLTFPEAAEIQHQVAEETKQEILNHKIIVRSALRKAVPTAVTMLRQYMSSGANEFSSELETAPGRSKAALRMRAAQIILSSARTALDDNLLTLLSERPVNAKEMQKTVFDFDSQIDEQGATKLVVSAHLVDEADRAEFGDDPDANHGETE